jgi:hypothetical protein
VRHSLTKALQSNPDSESRPIFYAAFKEEYHMTPTEWMKRNL